MSGGLTMIHESAELRAFRAEGNRDLPPVLVFCSLPGFDRRPEITGTIGYTGRRAIFLQSGQRTWFALPEQVHAVQDIVAKAWPEADQIDTFGYSMGAYPALAYGTHLPIRNAVAFAPRASHDPARVPDRRDYGLPRALRQRMLMPDVGPGLSAVGAALVLHGSRGHDLGQIAAFPGPPNTTHLIWPGQGHQVADALKQRGAMHRVIGLALDGRMDEAAAELARFGVVPRHSAAARRALALGRALFGLRILTGRTRPPLISQETSPAGGAPRALSADVAGERP